MTDFIPITGALECWRLWQLLYCGENVMSLEKSTDSNQIAIWAAESDLSGFEAHFQIIPKKNSWIFVMRFQSRAKRWRFDESLIGCGREIYTILRRRLCRQRVMHVILRSQTIWKKCPIFWWGLLVTRQHYQRPFMPWQTRAWILWIQLLHRRSIWIWNILKTKLQRQRVRDMILSSQIVCRTFWRGWLVIVTRQYCHRPFMTWESRVWIMLRTWHSPKTPPTRGKTLTAKGSTSPL